MKSGCFICFILFFALCATKEVVAQIEKQASTYDLTLEDCLTSTLTHNPEIRQARSDVERAAGTRLVYRSTVLPQLFAQASAGVRGGNLYNSPDIKTITNGTTTVLSSNNAAVFNPKLYGLVTAEFSQPLLDAGIPHRLQRGRLEVVIAQQNLNRAITDRLYEARVVFLQALYFRDLIAVYEEINKRLQSNVQSEQQRLKVGAGNEAALKSAEVQQLNQEFSIANLRNSYFSFLSRIAGLCGQDPGRQTNGSWQVRLPKPVGTFSYEPVTLNLDQEATYAREHRADLKLLQALMDAAAADKQTVRALYLPTVSLVASGLFIPQNLLVSKQTDIVPQADTRTSEIDAGAALSWRVIDNGQLIGASHELEAVQQAYEIMLHKLEQNIPRELATVAGSLQSADARRKAFLKSAESAEENLRLVESQVAVGEATQFDFLKAQSNLLSVRAGILEATWSHEVARAELDHVTGRYLQYTTGTAP